MLTRPREYIEQIISDKINEVRSKVLKIKATAKDYTTTTLWDNLNLLKKDKGKESLVSKRLKAAWNKDFLLKLIKI